MTRRRRTRPKKPMTPGEILGGLVFVVVVLIFGACSAHNTPTTPTYQPVTTYTPDYPTYSEVPTTTDEPPITTAPDYTDDGGAPATEAPEPEPTYDDSGSGGSDGGVDVNPPGHAHVSGPGVGCGLGGCHVHGPHIGFHL